MKNKEKYEMIQAAMTGYLTEGFAEWMEAEEGVRHSRIFSVKEQMPNDGEQVIIIRADGFWCQGSWTSRYGWLSYDSPVKQDIAYWMRVFVPKEMSK